MATAHNVKTKVLMLREVKRVDRCFHKLAGEHLSQKSKGPINQSNINDSPSWVPHPRTGIYFPKGHEWVMNDVPESAASCNQTIWLRNVDGVEKPDPDATPDSYLSSSL